MSVIKARAPVTGGNFGVWGGLFSSFDCAVKGWRQKEDMWNAIISGFLTGGCLAARSESPPCFVRFLGLIRARTWMPREGTGTSVLILCLQVGLDLRSDRLLLVVFCSVCSRASVSSFRGYSTTTHDLNYHHVSTIDPDSSAIAHRVL